MSSPTATSSSPRPRPRTSTVVGDLAEARRLSRILVGERDGAARPAPPAAPGPSLAGGQPWEAVLEDCVRQVPAIAAFVVDARGLLVAAAGALAPALLEGTGARLALALRHLESLPATTATSRTIMVEYDGEWLTGMRLHRDDGELLLGVISDRPVSPTARGILRAALGAT